MLSRSVASDSFVTPWTVACQAPLSMGLSQQEDWGGLSFPTPGALPNSGMEPTPPAAPALAGGFSTTESPGSSLNRSRTNLKTNKQTITASLEGKILPN